MNVSPAGESRFNSHCNTLRPPCSTTIPNSAACGSRSTQVEENTAVPPPPSLRLSLKCHHMAGALFSLLSPPPTRVAFPWARPRDAPEARQVSRPAQQRNVLSQKCCWHNTSKMLVVLSALCSRARFVRPRPNLTRAIEFDFHRQATSATHSHSHRRDVRQGQGRLEHLQEHQPSVSPHHTPNSVVPVKLSFLCPPNLVVYPVWVCALFAMPAASFAGMPWMQTHATAHVLSRVGAARPRRTQRGSDVKHSC